MAGLITPLLLLAAASHTPQPAVVVNATHCDWETRCTLESLQGLVNRDGPRLFVDNGNWHDERWMEIYAERYGIRWEPAASVHGVLERFAGLAKGLVVYDPEVDGTRYVAITLAGIRDLIPVAPAVLDGSAPALRAGQDWPGFDFAARTTALHREHWHRSPGAALELFPDRGLALTQGNPDTDAPWSFVTYGPAGIDLDAYPFLEVELESVSAGASAQVKLTWDRNRDGRVEGGNDDLCLPAIGTPAVHRWNIQDLTDLRGRLDLSRIQLHVLGPEGSCVTWRRVRFVGHDGVAPGRSSRPASPLAALPVVMDLRDRFRSSPEAYEWFLDSAWASRGNLGLAHAVDGACDGVLIGCGPMSGFDWQTQNRGLVFNLTSAPEVMSSYGDSRVGGSPEQARVYTRVLEHLTAPAMINGYGEPEDHWCKQISEHGHYSVHFGQNWSFHHGVPARAESFTPPPAAREEMSATGPGKYLVCFMTSEGDTLKATIPFFFGSWFDPERGNMPMNWGINPILADLFPAMLEYYYDTATPNDAFFVGCSGAGYVYPDYMPNLEQFCRHTREATERAGLSCIDLWGTTRGHVLETYARETQPLGLTVNKSPARMEILPDGTPVAFHGLAYWQAASLGGDHGWYRRFRDPDTLAASQQWLAGRIQAIAERHYPPFIILVYADEHSCEYQTALHKGVADLLPTERFEVCRLDTAFERFRAYARDRVLVGATGLQQRLTWAAVSDAPTTVPLVVNSMRSTDVRVRLRGPGGIDIERGSALRAGTATLIPDITIHVPGDTAADTVELELELQGRESQRLTAELHVLPPLTGSGPLEFVDAWPATELRHAQGGVERVVAGALSREVYTTDDRCRPGTHVVFGPYAELDPGRVVAAFRLRREGDVGEAETVAELDVFTGGYEGLGRALTTTRLTAADLPPEEWCWTWLECDWPGAPSLLETRVLWTGNATISLDRVVLFRTVR